MTTNSPEGLALAAAMRAGAAGHEERAAADDRAAVILEAAGLP